MTNRALLRLPLFLGGFVAMMGGLAPAASADTLLLIMNPCRIRTRRVR
jgi:hypothetical protein